MRELFTGRYARITAGLMVSEFVAATQGLVIAAIVPRVVGDLHGLSQYPLAYGSFFLAFLIFLPFAGPWADRYGLRTVLAVALALLGGGLLFVALAPNMTAFVVARFIEGIGDGLDYTIVFAVVAKALPEHLRARMFSLNATMWVVPGLIAPALGAFVATTVGWRWAFGGLVPLVGVAAFLLCPAVDAERSGERSDPLGAVRILFSRATVELRAGLHASLVAYALLHAAFFGADAYLALMLTGVRGISLQAASICLTLATVGWSVSALGAPAVARRCGMVLVLSAAAAGCFCAVALLTGVALGAPVAIAYAAWFVGGAGIGLGYPTLSAAMLSGASPGREGAVSSATALAAIVGLLAGTLLCGLPVALSGYGWFSLRDALAATFTIAAAFSLALVAVATGRGFPAPDRTPP